MENFEQFLKLRYYYQKIIEKKLGVMAAVSFADKVDLLLYYRIRKPELAPEAEKYINYIVNKYCKEAE